jgi:curved DNA-binding protein CbpA
MDPRKILGVGSDATSEEIQRAYREKVKKHHPDVGGDVWAFQQVNEAYELLTNPRKKGNHFSSTAGNSAAEFDSDHRQNHGEHPSPKKAETSRAAKPSKHPSGSPPKPGLLHRELPLQNETTFFIFINVMDIFMTYVLLRFGAMEANPIANFFFMKWGFYGMIAFKLVNVLIVCLIAQFVATKKMQTGKALLNVGSLIVGIVVVYSTILFYRKFVI